MGYQMRKFLWLLVPSLLSTAAFASEKLILTCDVEGTKLSYLSQPKEERLTERVQIDIEPFEAPPQNPELSFISYRITVRGSPSAIMTIFAPDNGVTKEINGNSFENKSNQGVLEYRYESSSKHYLREIRIDRKSGFMEAHKFTAAMDPLPGLDWATTVRYTGNCKKQTSSKNLF